MFCLIGMVVGTATIFRKSVDAFSGINIPLVSVLDFHSCMPTEEIEADSTSSKERPFTRRSGSEQVESGLLPDLILTNTYFQSGRDASSTASDNSNLAVTNLRRHTSETLRPVIPTQLLALASEAAKVKYFSLARAISGGLLFSGLVTCCFVPVVYLLMHRKEAADEAFAEVAYA